MANEISILNLSFEINKKKILNSINLELSSSQIIGLLGEDHSGKSTLLKIIAGVRRGYKGSILLDGKEIDHDIKSRISYLPDEPTFSKKMKIKQIRDMYKDLFNEFDLSIFESLTRNFSLDLEKTIKELSIVEIHHLALALAIAKKAKIYLFDEPLKYFDEKEKQFVLYCINEYCAKENSTVIISSSNMDEIDDFCNIAIFLSEGKINLVGEINHLHELHDMSLYEIYKNKIGGKDEKNN